jgi:hypothetical protein
VENCDNRGRFTFTRIFHKGYRNEFITLDSGKSEVDHKNSLFLTDCSKRQWEETVESAVGCPETHFREEVVNGELES